MQDRNPPLRSARRIREVFSGALPLVRCGGNRGCLRLPFAVTSRLRDWTCTPPNDSLLASHIWVVARIAAPALVRNANPSKTEQAAAVQCGD